MRLNGETGQRNLRRIAIAGVAVAAMLAGVISPAQAEPSGPTVKTIVIEDRDAVGITTLTLTFDGGISKAESEKVRASLAGSLATPKSIPVLGTPMWCGSFVSHGDSNGTLTMQYFCGPNATGSIPWGFQLSGVVQAIVVGDVSENRLLWWVNGEFAGQNSPHNVPAGYQFHGTMAGVYSESYVQLQDYMSFRHNVGSGGTGVVTFAAEVTLL